MERVGVMVNIIQGYGYFAVALNTLALRYAKGSSIE